MFKDLIILIEIDFKEFYTDNESIRSLVKNFVYYERTKHIDIQYYFVRKSVIKERTNLLFIRLKQQLINDLIKIISNET